MKVYLVKASMAWSTYKKELIQYPNIVAFFTSYDMAEQFIKDKGYEETDIELFKDTVIYAKEWEYEDYTDTSVAWIVDIDIVESLDSELYKEIFNRHKELGFNYINCWDEDEDNWLLSGLS